MRYNAPDRTAAKPTTLLSGRRPRRSAFWAAAPPRIRWRKIVDWADETDVTEIPSPCPRRPPSILVHVGRGEFALRCAPLIMNQLAAGTLNLPRAFERARPPGSGRNLTAVQRWVVDSIDRHVPADGEAPEQMNEEDSLSELLEARGLYSCEPRNIAEFDFARA